MDPSPSPLRCGRLVCKSCSVTELRPLRRAKNIIPLDLAVKMSKQRGYKDKSHGVGRGFRAGYCSYFQSSKLGRVIWQDSVRNFAMVPKMRPEFWSGNGCVEFRVQGGGGDSWHQSVYLSRCLPGGAAETGLA